VCGSSCRQEPLACFARRIREIRTQPWQAARVVLLQDVDELLAYLAPEIPRRAGIAGAREHTELQRVFQRVGFSVKATAPPEAGQDDMVSNEALPQTGRRGRQITTCSTV
jgi:hypothetical protein